MSKETKQTILGVVGGLIVMFLIGFMPAESEQMTREAWIYLGCFAFMLIAMISKALPDWAAVLATMVLLVAFKISKISGVTSQFAGSTVWLCIGVFLMSIGVNNCGVMKRLALWVLCKFSGTYSGQVTAMMLAGVITTPIIPSSTAKSSMMAPVINQVCEATGIEKNSKQALGLWFANFMGTNQLGMAFVSGSVYVALMMGFVGETLSWGTWISQAVVWYIVTIILTYLFCLFYCKPSGEQKAASVDFIKEQYEALGKVTLKEKQGIVIILIALVLWLTQSVHGIDAASVALLAVAAFVGCGLITAPEVGAKGMWTITLFVGGVLGVAGLMSTLGVSDWMASILGPILAPILSSPYIFVPCLCIVTYILRLAVVSQSCAMAIMVAVFGPLLPQYGISTFVLVFVSWVSGTCWNTSYQNPPTVGLIAMANRALDYPTAQKGSFVFCIINVIAMTASVPLWQMMGLL